MDSICKVKNCLWVGGILTELIFSDSLCPSSEIQVKLTSSVGRISDNREYMLQNICEVSLVETLGGLVMLFNILQKLIQDL